MLRADAAHSRQLRWLKVGPDQKIGLNKMPQLTRHFLRALIMNCRRMLAMSRGEFIAFLDSDDYWRAEKLNRQVNALRSGSDCTADYTNALLVERSGVAKRRFNSAGDTEIELADLLHSGNFLHTSSTMFRAALKEPILSVEDEFIVFQLHLELAKHGKL